MSISKESISDAAMADCIFPTDVMLSILTRLPAKSIQRFKFVSKLWSELFSSPEFIKMYKGQFSIDPNNQSIIIYENSERVVHLIITGSVNIVEQREWVMNLINVDSNDSPKKPSILDLPLSGRPRNLSLIGCYNGWICMDEMELNLIFLWNPAMEMFQHIRLSQYGEDYREDFRRGVSLGLGYDAGAKDFKLVRFVSLFGGDMTSVDLAEVYSVNSDVWTTIDVNLSFGVGNGSSVVIVNGNPYWLGFINSEAYNNNEEDVLVYFDVKLLSFKIVPLPPGYVRLPFPYSWMRYKGFVDWNGTLGYLECAHNKEKTESYAKVWVFEDSWRCKETLGPIRDFVHSFVMCLRNGNILGYQDKKCFVYDRQSNCVEEIMTMGHYSFGVCGYTANFERMLKKSLPQILNAR